MKKSNYPLSQSVFMKKTTKSKTTKSKTTKSKTTKAVKNENALIEMDWANYNCLHEEWVYDFKIEIEMSKEMKEEVQKSKFFCTHTYFIGNQGVLVCQKFEKKGKGREMAVSELRRLAALIGVKLTYAQTRELYK